MAIWQDVCRHLFPGREFSVCFSAVSVSSSLSSCLCFPLLRSLVFLRVKGAENNAHPTTAGWCESYPIVFDGGHVVETVMIFMGGLCWGSV
jgi:hypothetical protein